MVKMVDYMGMVPAELCTIDREGGADDFLGCGHCFEGCGDKGSDCDNCVVNKLFHEYAVLTGQTEGDGKTDTDADVDNFVVNYTDGTHKVIRKGFFCEMKEDGQDSILSFIMTGVSGKELSAIVIGCIQLAEKLGLFDKGNSCQNKECPYYKEDEDCPAREGCAGYERADEI